MKNGYQRALISGTIHGFRGRGGIPLKKFLGPPLDLGTPLRFLASLCRMLKSISPRYNLDWDDYYSHDDINAFIDELADTYSGFVSTRSIGSSFEGRDMRVIEITRAGPGAPNIWIEAGEERISP